MSCTQNHSLDFPPKLFVYIMLKIEKDKLINFYKFCQTIINICVNMFC